MRMSMWAAPMIHLGTSIQNMATQIRRLMDDIVAEHESKRKNEFDVLQSQINPHFLYYAGHHRLDDRE